MPRVKKAKQLDLFSPENIRCNKTDSLLDRLSEQAANVRYLCTRLQYSDLGRREREVLTTICEKVIMGYCALCNEFSADSYKYATTDFFKLWPYNPEIYSQVTHEPEECLEHAKNCLARFNGIMKPYKGSQEYGTIIERIYQEFINLIVSIKNVI